MKQFTSYYLLTLVLLFAFYRTNAQSNIIGTPIKIGKLIVAQFDFPNKMSWNVATNSCASLGAGWRLPTKVELNILYNNVKKIGNVGNDGYWTSTENGAERAWRQYLFNEGWSYDDVKYGSGFVRAVANYTDINFTGKINDISVDNSTFVTSGESSTCIEIVDAYELAVKKNITALRKIRNGSSVSANELSILDNDIRKWQNIVMKKCALDPNYSNRVLNIMQQLQLGYNSTFPSIKENSNSSSKSNSQGQSVCSACKPSNSKGWQITDYDPNKKIYTNARYVQKPGYKPCFNCAGTGNCKASNKCSSSQERNGDYTCQSCRGDRFIICSSCKGTGKK